MHCSGAECSRAAESDMAEVFSSSSETVLQRSVDVSLIESGSRPEDLQELYQITETCSFITSNNFRKVNLDLTRKHFRSIFFWVKCVCLKSCFLCWSICFQTSTSIFTINQHSLLLNTGSFAVPWWTSGRLHCSLCSNRERNPSKDLYFRRHHLRQVSSVLVVWLIIIMLADIL